MTSWFNKLPIFCLLIAFSGCTSTQPKALAPSASTNAATSYQDWNWSSTILSDESGDGVWTGVFQDTTPADPKALAKFEKAIGRKVAVQMWFKDFSSDFPVAEAEQAWKENTVPNVTWEPWIWTDKDKIHLQDIVSGKWDKYIQTWGQTAARWGKPVFVRWGHEFNGDWYPWSLAKNGSDPQLYIKAFQRVHDLVAGEGANNIIWVWCPNQASFPPKTWNNPLNAYPGDKYVDWIAIDGYDFDGDSSFTSLFGRIYGEIVKTTDKPIYIGEMSTGRKAGEKAAWYQDMHEALATKFPGIKGLVWFDVKKERDWRLEESDETTKGAFDVFGLPFYKSSPASVMELSDIYSHDLLSIREQAKSVFLVSRSAINAPRLALNDQGKSDWTKVPAVTVQGATGSLGQLKTAWDEKNLYLHLEANVGRPMKNLMAGDGIWNGDDLEFCLSTNPAADPDRGYFDTSDWQLGFSTGDGTPAHLPRSWEWSKLKSLVPGATVTCIPTEGGWTLDAVMPWTALGDFHVKSGMKLGFDTSVDLAGPNGTRASQWVWNGNEQFYNSPAQWGTINFLE